MTILAQLSESHITAGARGDAAAAALERAVQRVLSLSVAPDAVVVTGDLTEGGRPEEYERFRTLVAALPMPVHLMAGNHDDPSELATSCFAASVGQLRLVAIDTTIAGEAGGRLEADRLAWLDAQLAADRQTPTIVAMHHPPIRTGIAAIDAIGLPDPDVAALSDLLRRNPHVLRVIAGHAHRCATGTLGGCGVFICPGVNLQLDLGLAGEPLAVIREPPGIGLHLYRDGALVSHVVPIGDFGPAWSGPEDELKR